MKPCSMMQIGYFRLRFALCSMLNAWCLFCSYFCSMWVCLLQYEYRHIAILQISYRKQGDVITYPCHNFSWTILIKETQVWSSMYCIIVSFCLWILVPCQLMLDYGKQLSLNTPELLDSKLHMVDKFDSSFMASWCDLQLTVIYSLDKGVGFSTRMLLHPYRKSCFGDKMIRR